jgi:ParB-like nuclease domain
MIASSDDITVINGDPSLRGQHSGFYVRVRRPDFWIHFAGNPRHTFPEWRSTPDPRAPQIFSSGEYDRDHRRDQRLPVCFRSGQDRREQLRADNRNSIDAADPTAIRDWRSHSIERIAFCCSVRDLLGDTVARIALGLDPQHARSASISRLRLGRESPANRRRHLDHDRVRRYAEVLDHLRPVTVFALEDQTLLLVDGHHRLVAAQQADRTTVRAGVRLGTKAEALQFAVDVAQAEVGVSADQARDAIRRYGGRQNMHEREGN